MTNGEAFSVDRGKLAERAYSVAQNAATKQEIYKDFFTRIHVVIGAADWGILGLGSPRLNRRHSIDLGDTGLFFWP